ncbi:amino acid ABC transporter permease [Pseudactinotalea sp.]|uniref:amino acid ABC transporter permease n=1 Tax=Pseudactinotalea sp. TaxID=1926260 RepID=UPI003B3A5382
MSAQTVLFDAPGPKARRNTAIANVAAAVALLGVLAFVAVKMGEKGQWSPALWGKLIEASTWQHYFLPGLQATLIAAAVSVVGALAFGFIFGLGRLASNRVIRWFCGLVVEFFRAVPVLIMMIAGWLLFTRTIPGIVPASQAPFVGVIIGLTLYNGSVIAELIRSGVHGLPKGQREAGLAIGMTRGKSIWNIELPQAIVAMLPSLVSQFVVILKDTALGSIVTYTELLRNATILGGRGGLLQILIGVAVVFIVINWLLSKTAEWLARRVSSRTSGRTRPQAPSAVVAGPGGGGGGVAAPHRE